MTCAVRCTRSRSATSMATIVAISAAHTQVGTSKLAKSSVTAAAASGV
jgi:hypothetical protein